MSEHRADAVDWQVIRNMAAQSDSPKMFDCAFHYAHVSNAIRDPLFRGELKHLFPKRPASIKVGLYPNRERNSANFYLFVRTSFYQRKGEGSYYEPSLYPELFNRVVLGATTISVGIPPNPTRTVQEVFQEEYFSKKATWEKDLFIFEYLEKSMKEIELPITNIIQTSDLFEARRIPFAQVHPLGSLKTVKEGQRWIHKFDEEHSTSIIVFTMLLPLLLNLPENLKPFHWLFMDSIGVRPVERMTPETFHKLRESGVKMIASEEYKKQWFPEIREVQTFTGELEDWIFATNLRGEPW